MEKHRIYYDLEYIKSEELKMLIMFDEICKKHNIKYSLSGGTLLGAVRHGGFIPWDDDIDVMMLRNDYENFCNIFMNEHYDGYFLQTFETDPYYLNIFAKLINLNIPAYIAETENLNIKKGLCIDIFPIDKAPQNYISQKIFISKLSLCSALKYSMLNRNEYGLKSFFHYFLRIGAKNIKIQKICYWENNIRKKNNYTLSNITYADFIKPPYKLTSKDEQPYNIFEEYSYIKFEEHEFMVIKDYKKYLTITYGDYMTLPPFDKRIPEHNFYHY